MLVRTKHLAFFEQHGELFAFHNLFGFIIGMSHDLVELIQYHCDEPKTRSEVDDHFSDQFESEQLDEFLPILQSYKVLVESQLEEERSVWRMVPVRARWTVFHQPSDTELTFWRKSGDNSAPDPQPMWASVFWREIDDERTVGQIIAELRDDPTLDNEPLDDKTILTTLASWVHHERQYLKLAVAPLKTFGPPHQWPSYIRSTMPYRKWQPSDKAPVRALDPLATPLNPPHDYYASEVDDASHQFDMMETTLSHLFRAPSPLLDDQTYGAALMRTLHERDMLHDKVQHIVEVGAGCGDFAAAVLIYLREHRPAVYKQIEYEILDLAPTLRAKQRETLEKAGVLEKVSWISKNAEDWAPEPNSIDLLLSNEVIGDFSTVRLTRELIGLDTTMNIDDAVSSWPSQIRERLGHTGEIIRRYSMPLRDAPDSFYFQTGALHFIATCAEAIRPGGGLYISEYGDAVKYPTASTHLDHLEFSTHFGQCEHVARHHGLTTTVEYIQDLIGLDREAKVLETSRTYFQNLRAMLKHFGVSLEKSAYTTEMFEELIRGRVALSTIGDLRFRWIDERCMGLAPHEFKALLGKKPASS